MKGEFVLASDFFGKRTQWLGLPGRAEFRSSPHLSAGVAWGKKQLIFDISKGIFLFITVTEVYVTGETTKQA